MKRLGILERRRPVSVEVVCVDGRRQPVQTLQPLGPYRHHAVLVLQHAVDDEERLADGLGALAIEQVRPDDHIGDAGLVM